MAWLCDTPKIASANVQPSWKAPMKPGADGAETAMAMTAVIATDPTTSGTWQVEREHAEHVDAGDDQPQVERPAEHLEKRQRAVENLQRVHEAAKELVDRLREARRQRAAATNRSRRNASASCQRTKTTPAATAMATPNRR